MPAVNTIQTQTYQSYDSTIGSVIGSWVRRFNDRE